MSVKTASISLNTRPHTDIQDITRELARLVEESGLRAGTLTVFCPSSTSGLTTRRVRTRRRCRPAALVRRTGPLGPGLRP